MLHRTDEGWRIVPLQFLAGVTAESLGLTGEESFSITCLAGNEVPTNVAVRVTPDAGNGDVREFTAAVRIDTPAEAAYFHHGGILQYVLRELLGDNQRRPDFTAPIRSAQ